MSLTDNEIIKALECCSDTDCDNCPFEEQCRRNGSLSDIALDLINSQKAEIDKLNIAFDVCKKEYSDMFDIAQKQKAEIEKFENIKATINKFWDMLLKCKIAKRKDAPTLEEFAEVIGEIEADAIKEFAERLKEKRAGWGYPMFVLENDSIDNLVKEMVGD